MGEYQYVSCNDMFSGQVPSLSTLKLPFVWKLHELLENAEVTGHIFVVTWLPCGKAFRVHKRQEFVEQIMPHYFNQSKFKSFQRQLHIYGFQRIHQGPDVGAYMHPKFIRGNRKLCLTMKRQKIKGKMIAASHKLSDHFPAIEKTLRSSSPKDFLQQKHRDESKTMDNKLGGCSLSHRSEVTKPPGNWILLDAIRMGFSPKTFKLNKERSQEEGTLGVFAASLLSPSSTKAKAGYTRGDGFEYFEDGELVSVFDDMNFYFLDEGLPAAKLKGASFTTL